MQQYKYNHQFLNELLKDAKIQYQNNVISKKDYTLLQIIINELMHGKKTKHRIVKPDDLDTINFNLRVLEGELGITMIEILLNLTEAIIKESEYYKIKDMHKKQTDSSLVVNALKFYSEYSEEQFAYLNTFANDHIPRLEITEASLMNRNRYVNTLSTLPVYNIDFIRLVKQNRLYDEASLVHEFRHALDVRECNYDSLNLNILSEMNPIGMELYYEMLRSKDNMQYQVGIQKRLNELRYISRQLHKHMSILKAFYNRHKVTEKMIMEVLKLENSKQLNEALIDLSSNCTYELLSYFVGTLNGIKLCNIAQEDSEASIEIQNKACAIMSGAKFIPTNLDDVLGTHFTVKNDDMKIYKEFKKKLR